MGLLQGIWLVLHYQQGMLTGTPLGYLLVSLHCGDLIALDLQSLHVLQQFVE